MTNESHKHSVFSDAQEIEGFSKLADDWWNPNGDMKPLHRFNPVRVDYIKQRLCLAFSKDKNDEFPLKGLKILDVGCGGGLLSESMSILGADVVGIDATKKMIKVASLHAKENNVAVDYRTVDVCDIALSDEKFDAVMVLEVVEHVVSPEQFLQTCADCVVEGGHMFVSTLNRTMKSYGLAIVGAEYILRWLPKGTHDWNKFLKPSEIVSPLKNNNIIAIDITGVVYSIFEDSWKLSKTDLDVNYMIDFHKE